MHDDLNAIRSAVLREATRPSRPWWTDALIFFAGNAIVATLVLVLVGDVYDHRWAGAGVIGATSAASVVLALRPQRRSWQHVAIVAGVVVPMIVVLSLGGGHTTTLDPECALAVLGISSVPAIIAVVVLTRIAFQPLRAITAGLAAGGPALAALHLTCEHTDALHLLAFHVAPVVVVAALLVIARARLRTQSFAT